MKLFRTSAVFVFILFYATAWHLHGRDPHHGVIIPKFYPPKGLSPAAMCYIVGGSSRHKKMTAALINMAVKGYVTIEKIAQGYQVQRNVNSAEKNATLSSGEKVIMHELVTSHKMTLVKDSYDERLVDVSDNLERQIKKEYQRKCFKDNRNLSYFGIMISVLVLMVYLIQQNIFTIEIFSLLGVLAAILGFVIYCVLESRHRKAKWGEVVIATAILVLLIGYYKIPVPNGVLLLAALLFIINGLFMYLLQAPTQFGRNLLDQIEGFKLYLSTAEQHRLEVMHPPEMTPYLFEKYLPYALALGIENRWSKQFALFLRTSTPIQNSHDYCPDWYEGASFSLGSHSMGFGALCEDIETILSEATDPNAMDEDDDNLF